MKIESVTQPETFSTKYTVKIYQINWEDLFIDLGTTGKLLFTVDEVIKIVGRNIVRNEASISVSDKTFVLLPSSTDVKAYIVEQLAKAIAHEVSKELMDHDD